MNSNGAAGGGFSPLRDGYRWSKDGRLLPAAMKSHSFRWTMGL
jgi:hypothetical protein